MSLVYIIEQHMGTDTDDWEPVRWEKPYLEIPEANKALIRNKTNNSSDGRYFRVAVYTRTMRKPWETPRLDIYG